MRILHAFNQPRSGGGSVAASFATVEALRSQGHAVEVFTRNSSDLPDGFRGRLQAGLSALHAPQSLRDFAIALREFKPQVVHVNELFPLISPDILSLCAERCVPIVMTCDDYHLTCPVRNHFRDGRLCTSCTGGREYWAVLRNCRGGFAESAINAIYSTRLRRRGLVRRHVSRFVTPSDFTSRWLVEHVGVDPERVTTVPHAISIPERAADPAEGKYAAFGGRFVPEKGIETLLEAARHAAVPVKLSRHEKHLVTIALPPQAEVVITRGPGDLSEFYRGSRMLVFPSLWFETFGIVAAEAMSHGIPVIGSRLGAIADLIEDGVDGLLFEPGDPRDLARKMAHLWQHPDVSRRLGQAARAKATALWSRERHARLVLEVYNKALDSTTPR